MSHCGKCDSGETIPIMRLFSRSIQEGESCSAATRHNSYTGVTWVKYSQAPACK